MNKKLYNDDWKDVIRPSILKRDKFKCQICNIKHRSVLYKDWIKGWLPADNSDFDWLKSKGFAVRKIYLQISHTDQNKTNNDYSNLRALCPSCHLRFDAQFRLPAKI
jgi:5-methylcytosine-specific restriction endonuclease McrA